jgi:hypothetical protein
MAASFAFPFISRATCLLSWFHLWSKLSGPRNFGHVPCLLMPLRLGASSARPGLYACLCVCSCGHCSSGSLHPILYLLKTTECVYTRELDVQVKCSKHF